MKKIMLAIIMLVLMGVTNVFAFGDISYVDESISSSATAIAAPITTTTAIAAPVTTNILGQQQGQGQVAVGLVGVSVEGDKVERPLLAAPSFGIPETNFITGEIMRYNLLPVLAGLEKYENQPVTSILYYDDGSVFGRIAPREVPGILIAQAEALKDVQNKKYDVICRKASHTLNVGTGGGSSASGTAGYSGTVLGIAGGGWAVADAYCTIWIYQVK